MNHFTIKDIENLCGIKAHTLRIWEQRYNIGVAKRKESLHRIYNNEDLKQLLCISFLYHGGYKISKIAELSAAEIKHRVETHTGNNINHELFIHQLVSATIDFDKEKFEKIVNYLVIRVGMEKCILEVFYPLLQKIGLLWITNHMIPAQEHFVSHIIRKKIISAIDGLEVDDTARNHILVFAPPNEFHEIPLLTANYFFRKHNNRTTYLGVNVLPETAEYVIRKQSCTHIYVQAMTNLCTGGLKELITSLCKTFPGHKIILGGPAGNCVEQKPQNLTLITSLQDMMGFMKTLNVKETQTGIS